MTSPKLSRRAMMAATAASASAAAFVGGLLDPSSAWAQSGKLLRVRANRAILSTDPGYMIGGIEMMLQYACLARLATYTDSAESWGWEASEFVSALEQVDPQTISFEMKKGIMPRP